MSNENIFNEYLEHLILEKNLSRKTVKDYSTDLNQFFNWLSERKLALTNCNAENLNDFLNEVANGGVAVVLNVMHINAWIAVTG